MRILTGIAIAGLLTAAPAIAQSPDDFCANHQSAVLDKLQWLHENEERLNGYNVVDIDHVVTRQFDETKHLLSCHLLAHFSNGTDAPGTLRMQPSNAHKGNVIYTWKTD